MDELDNYVKTFQLLDTDIGISKSKLFFFLMSETRPWVRKKDIIKQKQKDCKKNETESVCKSI